MPDDSPGPAVRAERLLTIIRILAEMAAMYVCLCNGVTERAIKAAAESGARTLSDLKVMTGCATTCGSCADVAMQVLDQHLAQTFPLPVFAVAA